MIFGRGDFQSFGPIFHIFLHNDHESDYEDRSTLFKAMYHSRRCDTSKSVEFLEIWPTKNILGSHLST